MKRFRLVVLSFAVFLGIMVIPSPAFADPSGCTVGTPTVFGHYEGILYDIYGSGTAVCDRFPSGTFRIEIKQDVSFAPDPVLASSNGGYSYDGVYHFQASTSVCDSRHSSGKYYARTYFSGSTYHDSPHVTISNTC